LLHSCEREIVKERTAANFTKLGDNMSKSQPLKIGLLADTQGEFAVVGKALLHGTQLAIEEINGVGGDKGRQMELIHLDPNMDIVRYQKLARRLVEQEKVDVMIGGILSAQRETVRAVVNRSDALYFYTNVYEGGVCDASMIGMGAVPEQQLMTSIPWMVEKFGKRVYTIAIENPFGKGSAAWARDLVAKQGGETIGEEFFPIGSSQFGPTVERIKHARPDWIMALNAGVSQDAFFHQAIDARLRLPPMLSSFKIMLTYDHKRLPPPLLDKMHVTASWVEEMDTPAATAFKKRWRTRYPDEVYISAMGYNAYAAVYMYATLVEKAVSTKKADLRAVIAKGEACIDAPGGIIRIDPKSQHTAQHMRLFAVGADHSVREVKDFGMVEPYWLGEVGCDLTKEDPRMQYTLVNFPRNN
jgi:branched-chain amino acid transport system substrate-binding protein